MFHPKFSIEAWHLEWFISTKVTKVAPWVLNQGGYHRFVPLIFFKAGPVAGGGSWRFKFLPQSDMCEHTQSNNRGKNKKKSCLHKGRFLYSCVLLRFGNTFRLMPSSAPSTGEHTRHMKTSLTT
jgi:hypothetical protein